MSRSRDSGEIAAPQHPTHVALHSPSPACILCSVHQCVGLSRLAVPCHLRVCLLRLCLMHGRVGLLAGGGGAPLCYGRLWHARDTRPAREVALKEKGSWLMPWLRHSASRRRAHSISPPRAPRGRARPPVPPRPPPGPRPARAPLSPARAVAGSAACRASCALCAELGLFIRIETCSSSVQRCM